MLDYNALNRVAQNFVETNEKARTSMSGYASAMMDVAQLQSKVKKGNELIAKRSKEIEQIEKKRLQNNGQLSIQDEQRLRYYKETLRQAKLVNEEHRTQLELNRKSLSVSRLITASLGSISNAMGDIHKKVKENLGFWYDQIKAVRSTEKSMGLLQGQTSSFRDNMYKSGFHTADILVNTKELAEIHGSFSRALGTNVLLNQEQLSTMSAMNQVLGLSTQQIGEQAGSWEALGVGVSNTLNSVEDLAKGTRKMGLNTVETYNKFEKILKKANLYSFKNGVKGMEAMAKHAQKYKVDMETVSGFADKLFDVEGAIEMSANLQVLGGAWSQIADPMQLMFKARNDMAGLQKDIVKAASGVAKFNSATGEFEISSLELHRMRGAAEMTGMSLEELRNQAIAVAKEGKIKMELGGSIKNKDVMEWITNSSQLKNGKMVVQLNGNDVEVKDLKNKQGEIQNMLKDQRNMEKLAKDAMTADQKYEALINKVKIAFLPLVESLDGPIGGFITKLADWLNKNSGQIFTVFETVAGYLKTAAELMIENPIVSGLTLLFGKTLLSHASWFANGISLAKGFNMASDINSGGGDVASGLLGKLFKDPKKAKWLGKGLKGAKGLGIVGTLAGLGYNFYENKEKGMELGENLGRSGMSGAGAGLGAWGGAAAGAALGTAIFPGVGTVIGGAIGGFAGGYGGEKLGDSAGDLVYKKQNDFISRPGMDPIPFNSADTLVGLKKDGGLGKALLNKAGVGSNGSSDTGGSIRFENALEVKGTILVKTSSGSTEIKVDDPIFRREITKMVQETISTNLAGGVRTNGKI